MATYDSRWSALKHYRDRTLKRLFNTSSFLGNVLIALLITYFLRFDDATPEMTYVLFLLVLSVGLWLTEAIPPFAVGIFVIAYLVLTLGSDYFLPEPMPVDRYVSTWTSNVIWLLLGGFFLADAMKHVKLDRTLFRFTVKRFGTQPKRFLFGLMMMTALASMVMSNTATTAMMITSILPLVNKLGKSSKVTKALLIGVPAAASVGGLGTIIGSTPNAIAVGALDAVGVQITFLTWMVFGIPLALILVWAFWKYIGKSLKDMAPLDLSFLDDEPEFIVARSEKRIVLFTLALTVLLWSTESVHGIPLAGTSAVPIVILSLTRIISSEEVRALPWDTLMLVAGGLALGRALVDVGLADAFIDGLKSMNLSLWLLAAIFGYLTLIMSNIMSNTAAASILIPISLGLEGIYQIAVPLIIAFAASCALFLPISTPPNAIAYSTKLLEQKDFRTSGIFFAVVAPFFIFPLSFLASYLIGIGFGI
ncbi:MAG: DASS family sodium-coupled anion symporter [Cryomorphaceae bacterium]